MILISFGMMLLLWSMFSAIPGVGTVIVGPVRVFKVFLLDISNGKLLVNTWVSLVRVFGGLD